jgi:DNA repair exonuclease SbcCD ATPase subunit
MEKIDTEINRQWSKFRLSMEKVKKELPDAETLHAALVTLIAELDRILAQIQDEQTQFEAIVAAYESQKISEKIRNLDAEINALRSKKLEVEKLEIKLGTQMKANKEFCTLKDTCDVRSWVPANGWVHV